MSNVEKSHCTACGFPLCYLGIISVECWNVDCQFYSKKHHEALLYRKEEIKVAIVDHEIDSLYNSNNYYGPIPATNRDKDIAKKISDLLKEYLDSDH